MKGDHIRGELPPPLRAATSEPPRLVANRPFLWLVLAEALSGVALWGYFLAAFGDASYRFDATPGQLGVLLGSFSVVFIPAAPMFGTLADRWSPKRMLLLATGGFVVAGVVAFLADSVAWLSASMALVGLTFGVVWPSRGALVPRLVEKRRLVQANGMMGAARELPMMVGPALAGLAVALWGRRAPYFVSLGALLSAVPFYALVPDRRADRRSEATFLRDLVAGLGAGLRVPVLRVLFGVAGIVMLTIGVLQTLEPLFVRSVLERGQDSLGFLWSMQGAGAFLASLGLVRLGRAAGAEMLVAALAVLVGGIGMLVYVAPGSFAPAVVGCLLLGAGYAVFFAAAQALIQRISTAPGKVSAVFIVIAELGPLLAALTVLVVGSLDVQAWLVGSAAVFVVAALAALWMARRPTLLTEEPATAR